MSKAEIPQVKQKIIEAGDKLVEALAFIAQLQEQQSSLGYGGSSGTASTYTCTGQCPACHVRSRCSSSSTAPEAPELALPS